MLLERKGGDPPAAAAGMRPEETQHFWCFTIGQRKIRMQPKGKLKRSDRIASIFLWLLGIFIVGLVILLLRGCG